MKRLLRVLLGLNGAALSMFEEGPRAVARASVRAFEAARIASDPPDLARIPVVRLIDLIGSTAPVIRLRVIPYEDGMLPVDEAKSLLALLVGEHPREVLEIGTYMGHTTRLMAENLDGAIIHTVDLPETPAAVQPNVTGPPKDDYHLIARRVVGREFKNQPCAARIRQHLADTANWDFREAGSPTFFFIDGSHTYEYCRSDSERCLAVAGGPSVFLWHDCDANHPGVVRTLREWRDLGRDVRRISGTALAYWKSA